MAQGRPDEQSKASRHGHRRHEERRRSAGSVRSQPPFPTTRPEPAEGSAAFELAAILFDVIWGYARHRHRILTGTLLGAPLPVLGMAVIASFIPYYWLPIRGEIAGARPRRDGGGQP
jgi:hypothetical protein